MSMPCPICGKAVDPLRSRSVAVREGKIVAYCSPECLAIAQAESSRPVSVKIRTPASGIAVMIPTSPDSGPIIEIIHEGSVPTKLPDAAPKRAGSTGGHSRLDGAPPAVAAAKRQAELAAAADADDDDEINGEDAPEAPEPRKLPVAVIVIAVIVLAGGVAIALKLLSHGGTANAASMVPAATVHATAAPVARVTTPTAAAAVPAAASAELAKPAAALERARGVLRDQLANGSPRVQRLAAAALARTGDAPALAALAAALHDETNDIARLDVAYALARGGDARGTQALVAALVPSQRRDVRAEAANQLARLGDARATPVLADYLDVSQLRVGAAEHLAYLAEPRALKALAALRADDKATADDRARAVIALGVAGNVEVTPQLRALLADPRFNQFAASALAGLHDPAARPVLVDHLAIPSLRTDAARALRRLEPELDAAPLLPPLVTALASAKDTDGVQAAEAVLLLTGPATWSKFE